MFTVQSNKYDQSNNLLKKEYFKKDVPHLGMNIFLDNNVFSIQKAGGVSVYWYELVKRMIDAQLNICFLNATINSPNIFERKIDYSNVKKITESSIPPGLLRYLPLRCKLPPKSIFHAGYLRISSQKNIVNIITVHDFAHEKGLSTSFPRRNVNILQKAYGIKNADGIICISENTKNDLLHFYPKVNPGKVKVIYHGISDSFFPLDKTCSLENPFSFDLKEKFILYVGDRKKYKNFKIAVDVIKGLPGYKLVLAGGATMEKEEINLLEGSVKGRYHVIRELEFQLLISCTITQGV